MDDDFHLENGKCCLINASDISDALGDYFIYIHEYNCTHDFVLLYIYNPSANPGIEVCVPCNTNHELKKRLKNYWGLVKHISHVSLSCLKAQLFFYFCVPSFFLPFQLLPSHIRSVNVLIPPSSSKYFP